MKYYAIRKPFKKIVTSWDECKNLVNGVKNVEFKSFPTKQSALNFIHNATTHEKPTINKPDVLTMPYIGTRVFVDGSFNNPAQLYGGSAIFLDNQPEPHITKTIQFSNNDPRFITARNVAGEIGATIRAINYAISQNISKLTIIHDYEGIAKWANGEWRAKKPIAITYKNLIQAVTTTQNLQLKFIWVHGHTGVKYNEACDRLAKEACGIKIK